VIAAGTTAGEFVRECSAVTGNFLGDVTDHDGEANSVSGIDVIAREAELRARMIRALDGDAAAYDSLLRVLVPQLRAFFNRRVRSEDVAEDLVQETLIAVHTKRATYDQQRPFSAWLYAIARYKMADYFRRSHRLAFSDELDEKIAAPDFEVASLALIDTERLLGDLPLKQQAAIRATKIEGLSIAEAAAAAGISQSDAKMSVYRGLKRLSARVQGKIR
jgi:RNA polymerase sigma-70 factor (ECF subfamily)